jgi:hypothetical protein
MTYPEMNVTPFEGELQKLFLASGRSDTAPIIATRSAPVDKKVK